MSKLLTIVEAFERFPELAGRANLTPDDLACMVGNELAGFTGIQSTIEENRVLVWDYALEDYLAGLRQALGLNRH